MTPSDFPHRNRIYRSRKSRVILGVCGGIAEHFDFPPAAVRLLLVLLALFTGPMLLIWILLYFVAGAMIREAPPEPFETSDQEEFWNTCRTSRPAALRQIHRRYQILDKRLQRMETIVTRPQFDLEDEYRDL